MDYQTDNPIARFKAFWWALALFVSFGLVLFLINCFIKPTGNALEDQASKARYEMRKKIEAAQDANLAYKVVEEGKIVQVPPHVMIPLVAEALTAAKPTEVNREDQLAPVVAAAGSAAAAAPADPAQIERGKAQFMLCQACHGADGNGTPGLAPPIAGSEWVLGPVENLIRMQLRGLTGKISVKGVDYDLPAPMAPNSYLTDEQIADVLTFARNSFGNQASAVTADQVKALRSEVGKPPLTAADLVPAK